MELHIRLAAMTTIVVPVPEADGVVDRWRKRYDWSATAGVPAHITLLGPFLPPDQVDSQVVERLRALFASSQPFRFRLRRVERLSGLIYLPPEPTAPFGLLTEMLEAEWPQAPRFGSAFERPLHHLTVARAESAFDKLSESLSDHLPIDALASEALLLEKRPEFHVRTIGRFPLGRPSDSPEMR